MKRKLRLLSAALLVGAAGFVASCGTGGDTVSSTDPSATVGTASLNIAVKFPDSSISPQYISGAIQCIEVSYNKDGFFRKAVLTPATPNNSLTDLIPGESYISIKATDAVDNDGNCTGDIKDVVEIKAYLKEGANQLVTTLISPAKWVFVDGTDNPVPITFNKLKTDSTETIESFNLISTSSAYSPNPTPLSLDFNNPSFRSFYNVAFIGSNLPVDNDGTSTCVDSTTCITEGRYYNQFIGPDQSNNSFETSPIPLSPVINGNDQYSREFFIIGVRPLYDNFAYYTQGYINDFSAIQADNTDIIQNFENNFAYTSVIDANHMEGAILEILNKSMTEDIICSFNEDGSSAFTCPPAVTNIFNGYNVAPASISISKNEISTQALDDNDCYKDVTVEEKEGGLLSYFTYCEVDNDGTYYRCDYNLDGIIDDNDDINGDGIVNKYDNYYVIKQTITNADICVYPFRAKAEEIPPTELQLTIQ